MSPLTEEKPMPFLTLAFTEINGWVMALCPEFEVSACGSDRNTVIEDLHDMIKRNAQLILNDRERVAAHMVGWSEEIIKHKDISVLFKRQG